MAADLTLVEKTIFLKSIDTLTEVPTEALAQLAARAEEVHCRPGEVLFREGEGDRGVFIVIEGSVELRKEDALVRILRKGMTHGELFRAEGAPHLYAAIAVEPTHLLNLRRDEVMEALGDLPEFAQAMVRELALRTHKLTERAIELEAQLRNYRALLREAGVSVPDLPGEPVAAAPATEPLDPKPLEPDEPLEPPVQAEPASGAPGPIASAPLTPEPPIETTPPEPPAPIDETPPRRE